MKRIVVTGTKGQVATALVERAATAGVEVVAIGRPDFDLAMPEGIGPALERLRPAAVISAAAYTAVDKAESEPDLARRINAEGAGAVAAAAAHLGVPLVHLSTDYVFDGTKSSPYTEQDPTGPTSVYGLTKLAGEEAVAAAGPNHAIVRVAWVYSPFGNNFVRTMLRLAQERDVVRVVADQHGGPTYALDIADAILAIAARLAADPSPSLRGVFHLPPQGEATWAQFAEATFAGAAARGAKACRVEPISTADYPTPARRPANSRLCGERVKQAYGITLPNWASSLDNCLDRLIGPKARSQV